MPRLRSVMSSSWQSLTQWASSIDWALWGTWTLTILLLVTGLLGTVLPLLPGPVIIFVGGVLHTVLRPESALSWWGITVMALLLALSFFVDFASGALGTKHFGGSKWGVAGVIIGGLVGLFFGLPGLIIGPIVGGFAAEKWIARKEFHPALRATWGTVVGTTVGMVVRVVISVAMVGVFFLDALWW
jgi:uncharacterized protein YqgC (DUF456 family)